MAVAATAGQQNTLTSTLKTALTVFCAATIMRRIKVFDLNVSQGGAPASTDTNIIFDFSRYTGATAGTATTSNAPVANDAADTTLGTLSGQNYSAEPTVYTGGATPTASLFNIQLNQRAPYRWQTYLGSGAELMLPATANAGGGLRVSSAGYTANAGGTMFFQEQ